MLKDLISSLSNKSRIYFCTQIFSRFDTPEVDLTNVESYCMECILALAEPSVQEFAHMMGISAPNAAYKVNALIRKGYIEKTQSMLDKREFYLKPTKNFLIFIIQEMTMLINWRKESRIVSLLKIQTNLKTCLKLLLMNLRLSSIRKIII